ncbi:hypothetical protein HDU83_006993 [Entophlyctis luteolus]|nr:hypothetical protein HDU83_006993 [Entophlyctis luteolus]
MAVAQSAPPLPREIWAAVFLHCPVHALVRLQQVCKDFRALAGRQNALLWKAKAAAVVFDFYTDPRKQAHASLLDVRMLPGETHFDVLQAWVAWGMRSRVARIGRRTELSIVPIVHKCIQTLPAAPGRRRFLVAQPMSHDFLVRWTCNGPAAYFHKSATAKIVDLSSGREVAVDGRLKNLKFVYAVPHSNWVIFRTNDQDYQLGYYSASDLSLKFVESSAFNSAVIDILLNGGDGRIFPLRGYGNTVVVIVRSREDGNDHDLRMHLNALTLEMVETKPGSPFEFKAQVKTAWTQRIHAMSPFVDDHNEFLIFQNQSDFAKFTVISISVSKTAGRSLPHWGPCTDIAKEAAKRRQRTNERNLCESINAIRCLSVRAFMRGHIVNRTRRRIE